MKDELRTKIRKRLREVSPSELHKWSLELSKNLKQLISQLNFSNVHGRPIKIGVYSPILQEPLWYADWGESFQEHEYCLVHMHEEIKLSYHPVEFKKIESGQVALTLEKEELEREDTPDCVLVPGLAFTERLERLGRGKAYFDSYLKDFQGPKIGVFFENQKEDTVYVDEHDVYLDYIVTEEKLYKGK